MFLRLHSRSVKWVFLKIPSNKLGIELVANVNAKEKLMVILAAAIKNLYGAKGAAKTLGYGRPIISTDMGQIRFLIVKFFVGIATAKLSNCKLAFYWINTDQCSFKKKANHCQ